MKAILKNTIYTFLLSMILFNGKAFPANEFFRSISTGNWNSTGTWQMSTNGGGTWIPATSTPINTSGVITIQSPNTVTVTANVSADQLVVNSGGTISINNGIILTILDGSGDDLTLNSGGTISGAGTVQTQGTAVSLLVRNGSNFLASLKVNSGTTSSYDSGSPFKAIFYGSITIDNGTTLSVKSGSFTIQAQGNVTNNGSITGSNSTFVMRGSLLTNNNSINPTNFNFDSVTSLSGTGTYTGTNIVIGTSGNISLLNDVTVSPISSFTINTGGMLNPNTKIFTINSGTFTLNNGASVLNSGSIRTQNTVTLNLRTGSSFNADLNVYSGITSATELSSPYNARLYGNVNVNSGATLFTGNTLSYNLGVYGNLTNNGSVTGLTPFLKLYGSSLVNNGSFATNLTFENICSVSGTGSYTGHEFFIGQNGNVSLSNNITISAEAFTINTGGILNPNTNIFTINSGTFLLNNGATVLNSGTIRTQDTVTLDIKTGSSFNADLNVNSGTTDVTELTFPYNGRLHGNVNIDVGATLNTGNTSSYVLGVYANVTNNGTITGSNSSFNFETGSHFLQGTGTWGITANVLTGSVVTLGSTHQMRNVNINTGGSFDLSTYKLLVTASNPIVNNGTFTTTNGTVEYNGASVQNISSANITYNKLIINNLSGTALSGAFTVNDTLSLTTGSLDLNGQILTISPTGYLSETAGHTVKGTSGFITTTRSLNAPNSLNVGGLGAILTTSSNLGITEIRRGHTVQTGLTAGNSIQRYFDISLTNNAGLNATFVFMYDDSELNGNTESDLSLYSSSNSGANWAFIGGTLNTSINKITLAGLNSIQPRYTSGMFLAPHCDTTFVSNGSFQTAWTTGYGSPAWYAGQGCDDPGYMQLSGNRKTGSAITKTLNQQIIAGHVYEVSVCARFNSNIQQSDYAKLRLVAFNGSLPVFGSNHPAPASNIAVVDISGKINCGDWTTYTFNRWKANKNFSKIAINCENNFGSSWIPNGTQTSIVDIDNICFVEVNDSIPCYIADFDSLGTVIPPLGDIDPLCPAMEDTIDNYMGKISDLYPNCGTENDSWYHTCPDSCSSIGGELPDSLKRFLMDDSLASIVNDFGFDSVNAFYDKMQKVEDTLDAYVSSINLLDSLFNLGALPNACDTIISAGPPPDPSGASPFGGRDIIFVHGFRTTPIKHKITTNNPGPQTRWPQNRPEFYDMNNGYWKMGANAYWRDQTIRELHTDPNPNAVTPHPGGIICQNRFLVVAHPSTQLGIIGVHAILEQIAKTMNGTNDAGIVNCGTPRPGEKFGQNGFVIISHSAGSLFSNVALSLAGYVDKTPGLKDKLGDISEIANKCKLHIAIQGAFKGSADAPIALGLASGLAFPVAVTNLLFDLFGFDFISNDIGWLLHSQFLDLAIPNFIYNGGLFSKLCPDPQVLFNPFCKLANAHLIEDVPMEVVTIAGGNSSDFGTSGTSWPAQIIVKQLLQRGFDDGVLSMDCQCGNKVTRPYYPNRFLPLPGILTLGLLYNPWTPLPKEIAGLFNERLYDMGIHRRLDNKSDRAIGYYLDQKIDVQVSIYMRRMLSAIQLMPTDPRLTITFPPYLLPEIYTSYMHASSGCIPSLSPTGMVQPEFEQYVSPTLPSDIIYDPTNRMDHHHSFIQSTSEHYSGVTNEYNSWPNYKPSHGITNSEEVRVMESNYLYDNNIVHNDMKTLPVRYIRGKKIGPWKIKFIKKTIGPFYIWKRFYDLLPGDCGTENYSAACDTTHQLDYIYKYILKP